MCRRLPFRLAKFLQFSPALTCHQFTSPCPESVAAGALQVRRIALRVGDPGKHLRREDILAECRDFAFVGRCNVAR